MWSYAMTIAGRDKLQSLRWFYITFWSNNHGSELIAHFLIWCFLLPFPRNVDNPQREKRKNTRTIIEFERWTEERKTNFYTIKNPTIWYRLIVFKKEENQSSTRSAVFSSYLKKSSVRFSNVKKQSTKRKIILIVISYAAFAICKRFMTIDWRAQTKAWSLYDFLCLLVSPLYDDNHQYSLMYVLVISYAIIHTFIAA